MFSIMFTVFTLKDRKISRFDRIRLWLQTDLPMAPSGLFLLHQFVKRHDLGLLTNTEGFRVVSEELFLLNIKTLHHRF